jgi:hypothetical protein
MGAGENAVIAEKDVREIGRICAEVVAAVNSKAK